MNITKQEKTAAGLLAIALALGSAILGYGRLGTPTGATPVVVEKASRTEGAVNGDGKASTKGQAVVVVHVGGSVVNPGVYTLPEGSRVVDAVKAAGGGLADSDLDALNLAAALADGQKIGVPTTAPVPAPATASPAARGAQAGFPVNVNTASAEELEGLPGVGPALAARIIGSRSKGRLASMGDLDGVSGIGPRMIEKLKPLVVF